MHHCLPCLFLSDPTIRHEWGSVGRERVSSRSYLQMLKGGGARLGLGCKFLPLLSQLQEDLAVFVQPSAAHFNPLQLFWAAPAAGKALLLHLAGPVPLWLPACTPGGSWVSLPHFSIFAPPARISQLDNQQSDRSPLFLPDRACVESRHAWRDSGSKFSRGLSVCFWLSQARPSLY